MTVPPVAESAGALRFLAGEVDFPLLPCASCGELVALREVNCQECARDPRALAVECETCGGEGLIRYALGPSPFEEEDGNSICPTCEGERGVNAPFRDEREAALQAARNAA